MTLTTPYTITFTTTPTGSPCAIAQYPVDYALQARHAPVIEHAGRTYVPFTGEVVAPYRNNVTPERPPGYYLDYRPLRQPLPAA